MPERKMTPVLKWAGGKTQLLEQITESMPTEYNRYYEPFIGGAAVLLGVSPLQAFINDVNEQLVNLYTIKVSKHIILPNQSQFMV